MDATIGVPADDKDAGDNGNTPDGEDEYDNKPFRDKDEGEGGRSEAMEASSG